MGLFFAQTASDPSLWQWQMLRLAGAIAAVLVICLMPSGIGQATKFTYRYIEPETSIRIHRFFAISLCGAVITHIFFLVIYQGYAFSILEVLIPGLKQQSNGTSFAGLELGFMAVAFGTLAAYCILLSVSTSLSPLRNDRPRLWKKLHFVGYATFILVFMHGLYVGTDLAHGFWRYVWLATGLLVISAICLRLVSQFMRKSKTKAD